MGLKEITEDRTFNIAFGGNRRSTSWKNKEIKWPELVKKLSITKRTNETVEEYQKMTKEQKGDLKDIGGFVCGFIKDGRRRAENILSRSMITLDLDHRPFGVWDTIELLLDFTCLMYSTHSHTPVDPRLRIIIPIDRDVTPEEYEAIARMIASEIDESMNVFDDTTYQNNRLMYLPSTCTDGEYIFKVKQGELLKADDVLNRYTLGWKDVEYWPRSKRELGNIKEYKRNKAQDPTTKTSYIGAFCRTYNIHEVIEEFLSEEYEPGKDNNRYTYTKSESTNGLYLIDENLAYSHQDTDPISGKGACNSFDLVRLHKFRGLDSDKDLGQLESKDLKSFIKMCEFVANDERAKIELLEEDFSKVEGSSEEVTQKAKEAANYLIFTEKGIKVNTGLLANFIRENSSYMIVKKQGFDNDILYWYGEGFYKRISSNELKGRIKSYIPEKIRIPSHWENVYKDLITDVQSISFEELDINEKYINVKNGLFNIKTKELESHNPDIKSTIQLNCNYDPNAAEPKDWIKFIETLSNNDKEVESVLQEWFGLALSNVDISKVKKCLILYSAVGDTGKTQYNKVLANILGLNSISSTPIQELTVRFATSNLYGKRMNIVDDQSAINIEDSSIFKAITGGGNIDIEFKGKSTFSYHYRGGISVCCNDLPYIKDDKGDHIYERMITIPCNNVIPEEKQIKNLAEKLMVEANGILLWALEGLNRLIANNLAFTNSKVINDTREDYKKMNDTVYKLLKTNYSVTKNAKDRVKKTDFETDYSIWIQSESDYGGVSKKNIRARMQKHGIPLIEYGHIFYYCGIVPKNTQKTHEDFC